MVLVAGFGFGRARPPTNISRASSTWLFFAPATAARRAAFSASATFFTAGLLYWLVVNVTDANTLANAQYSSWVQRSVGCLWHWAHSSRTPRNAAATFSPHTSAGTSARRRQNRSSVFLFG